MSFIRPEILRGARRLTAAWFSSWLEAGAVLVALGLGIASLTDGLRTGNWLSLGAGGLLVALGAGALIAFRRNARLSGKGDGAGIVQVAEGRIAYLAPRNGGFADRDRLTRVEIVISNGALPEAWWVLWQEADAPLVVHSGARGMTGLIDLVSSLPGARMAEAVTALGGVEPARTLIWARPGWGDDAGSAAQPHSVTLLPQ